jgi:hypothetical protein
VVDVPRGPRRIGPKNQVSVPAELLAAIGVEQGQDVWIAINGDRPGTLVVIPEPLMELVFRSGMEQLREDGALRRT